MDITTFYWRHTVEGSKQTKGRNCSQVAASLQAASLSLAPRPAHVSVAAPRHFSASSSAMATRFVIVGIVCCGSFAALLLRRLWRVHAVAAKHRKRRRQPRAWVALASTWHMPLLLLGLAITIARLAFLVELYVFKDVHIQDSNSQRRRLWVWLELPNALIAIVTAYLLFLHAHVALYRVWPIRMDSTATALRLLLYGFGGLLLSVVLLLAYGREASEPIFTPQEWTRHSLEYFAIVWIVLGAMLLKFTGDSADIMWTERDAGRLLILSPRGLHALITTETMFSLVVIVRGILVGILASAPNEISDEAVSPTDPSTIRVSAFLLLYGVWELLTVGVIYCLCGCVPLTSRARRLIGYADDPESGQPLVNHQPVLHFELPSPQQAVEGYWRSAAKVLSSQNRRVRRYGEEISVYESSVEMDADDTDRLLMGESAFHEPLLSDARDDEVPAP